MDQESRAWLILAHAHLRVAELQVLLSRFGDVVDIDVVQRQPHGSKLRDQQGPRLAGVVDVVPVVTGDTVLVDQCPLR